MSRRSSSPRHNFTFEGGVFKNPLRRSPSSLSPGSPSVASVTDYLNGKNYSFFKQGRVGDMLDDLYNFLHERKFVFPRDKTDVMVRDVLKAAYEKLLVMPEKKHDMLYFKFEKIKDLIYSNDAFRKSSLFLKEELPVVSPYVEMNEMNKKMTAANKIVYGSCVFSRKSRSRKSRSRKNRSRKRRERKSRTRKSRSRK